MAKGNKSQRATTNRTTTGTSGGGGRNTGPQPGTTTTAMTLKPAQYNKLTKLYAQGQKWLQQLGEHIQAFGGGTTAATSSRTTTPTATIRTQKRPAARAAGASAQSPAIE